MAKEDNSSGVFALVMAVLGILLPVSALPLGIVGGSVCSVLGLIFGIAQLRKEKNRWAVWAVVLSVLGLILNIVIIYLTIVALKEAATQYQQLQNSGLIDNVKQAADLARQYGSINA